MSRWREFKFGLRLRQLRKTEYNCPVSCNNWVGAMDRLGTMEAFAAVVETGSFSAAAQKLRSSKSLVSRQIAALEAELGARLFHRTTRSLTLTEEGRGYHAQLVRILGDIAEANAAVTNLQAAPRGKLRINAPMSFGYLHL